MPPAPTEACVERFINFCCCTALRARTLDAGTPPTHIALTVCDTRTHRVVVKPEMPHLCIDATNNTYTTHAATPRQTRKLSCLIYFRNLCLSAAILVLCLSASLFLLALLTAA